MTKEELIKENTVLKEQNLNLQKAEKEIRDNISSILFEKIDFSIMGGMSRTLQSKSWFEICSKIGELINIHGLYYSEKNLLELENKLKEQVDLNRKLQNKIDNVK